MLYICVNTWIFCSQRKKPTKLHSDEVRNELQIYTQSFLITVKVVTAKNNTCDDQQ